MKIYSPQNKKIPKVYVYKDPRNSELLKVGYTEGIVEKRIREQQGAGVPVEFEILHHEIAIDIGGNSFTDKTVHKRLVDKDIEMIVTDKGRKTEWFRCELSDVKNVILEIKNHINTDNNKRINDFKLREEQERAVNETAKYFQNNNKNNTGKVSHYLWNAKPRFGKTFTTYQLAKKMNWRNILVLTYKPAVKDSWEKDLKEHIDFNGWRFINRDDGFDNLEHNNPIVVFASLQDILGKTKDDKLKKKFDKVRKVDWDCIVFDEYHFGAWREATKDLYSGDNDKEVGIDTKLEEEYNETVLVNKIKTDHILYLSGTPFRAIATGEFLEDQIFNWTYIDEQKAKKEWDGNEENNPYKELPQMVMYTYKLPDEVMNIAKNTDQNEFSLNEFFSVNKDTGEFNHIDKVQRWLNIIQGNENIYNDKAELPFKSVRLLQHLNHTFWYLPNVASCNAMDKLLNKTHNDFFNRYQIINASGKSVGNGDKALIPVRDKIGKDGLSTKTIILSCGKLTTGVTIKELGGIFLLRDTISPESYFQSIFRVQNPWVMKDKDDKTKKIILKEDCYVFDFAPNRALTLVMEYGSKLAENKEGVYMRDKVQELINFLPILAFNGEQMEELDATKLIDYVQSGTTATMLARKWQDANLLNTNINVLEKLFEDKELLEKIEDIEAFRAFSADIQQLISSNQEIEKIKSKSNMTEKEEKIIDEEKKKNKKRRETIKDKLLKFLTRIPAFMYLTEEKEQTLKEVILNIEPNLFRKMTGLEIKDFQKMCDLGVFNGDTIDIAIEYFKRYEEGSYGRDLEEIGLFDSTISARTYYGKVKDLIASGNILSNKRFKINKNSQAVLDVTKNVKENSEHRIVIEERESFINNGILKRENDYYIFTKDCIINSPSLAAEIVSGNSVSGFEFWKDENGEKIKKQ